MLVCRKVLFRSDAKCERYGFEKWDRRLSIKDMEVFGIDVNSTSLEGEVIVRSSSTIGIVYARQHGKRNLGEEWGTTMRVLLLMMDKGRT